MSNDEMKRLAEVVRKIVKEENQPIIEKLDSVYDQVADLTEKVDGEIIPTLEKHTKYFKQIAERLEKDNQRLEKNEDNIERLDKRLTEPEARLGIQPPPELHIIK